MQKNYLKHKKKKTLKKKKIRLIPVSYYRKKFSLFFKRNIARFKKEKFDKILIIRLRSNNVFCTFNDIEKRKTIFSCLASRYFIKITAKRLKHQILRILTFFYHEIKKELTYKGLIIKIFSPKYLRAKIFRWCKRYLSRFLYKKNRFHRPLFFQLKDNKAYNGCRVKKKRRKKRRRRRYFKKI